MDPTPSGHRGGIAMGDAPSPPANQMRSLSTPGYSAQAQVPPVSRRYIGDVYVSPGCVSIEWVVVKRILDVVISLTALILALPLMVLIAVAIRVESPGSIFFRSRRVGYHGQKLMMLKFRKMRTDAGSSPLTVKADARLTRVGAFLTAARLDELPQLWDVLRGRMSVIGPRPEDPQFVELHLNDYREILTVRPGMIGLSQLAYEAEKHILEKECPIDDYVQRILPQKLTLDRLYARRTSPRMDTAIVRWALVALLLRHPVAVNRSTGSMNVRRRRAARG